MNMSQKFTPPTDFIPPPQIRFNANLGPKGAKPPKRQRNPRKPKIKGLPKFIAQYFNGDVEEANKLIQLYQKSNLKIQESILTVLICHKKVDVRTIRELFHIGTHRFHRIKRGDHKRKPGGDKPNFVSKMRYNHFISMLVS